jgi:exosortase/archaeosortase family protein
MAWVYCLAWAYCLAWVYWGTLIRYLADQHYQEHFLFLWVFLVLALARSLRPPFRVRFGLRSRRDRIGVALTALSWLLLMLAEAAGSGMLARSSLVLFSTGMATLAVPTWNGWQCAMHGLLMLLCFGLPYSVWFPITEKLQWGVAAAIAVPARLGLANYRVEDAAVLFADYRLAITADCSGLGQLLTFVGIAALGVLASARNRRRAVGLMLLAIVLAWLSNLARVSLFVLLCALGARWTVENRTAHAVIGFLVFVPFVYILVRTILRSWVPLPVRTDITVPPGRVPIALLALPLLVGQLAVTQGATERFPAPTYFATLEAPPGYALELRGASEASDRIAYATDWLVNARFRDASGHWFDLFHYATRSQSHLCVHKVANCLDLPGHAARYVDPVVLDGKPWWRIALERDDGASATHVYFAFELGGERHDDSFATQFEVFRQRLLGRSWEVRCSRVVFDGPLPPQPTAAEAAVLRWLGALTAAP